jgi:hypothetical protein
LCCEKEEKISDLKKFEKISSGGMAKTIFVLFGVNLGLGGM